MKKFEFKRKASTAIQRQFNFEQTVGEYLEDRRLQKRSAETIKTYNQTLRHVGKYFAENGLLGDEPDCIEQYIRYMTFEKTKWDDHPTSVSSVVGVVARTVNNIIRNVRIFYNWAQAKKLIDFNPAELVGYQTEDEESFDIFTDDEIQLLLGAPNQRTYTGLRDYIMMLVLVDTGLRVGEMTALVRGDFDLAYRQINVTASIAKGRKARFIPLSQTTANALRELFEYIGIPDDAHDEYVFLTQYGDRYFGGTFAKMLKKYAARAGESIKARVSPHTFRHYFAVKFLRNGGDPFALMKILGHTDIAMTQKYVRYARTDITEAHAIASPVESLVQGVRKRRGSVRFR